MKDMSKDLILFSTADWDNPFWTNKQHMAVGLAGHGFRIFYVESLGLRKLTMTWRDIFRIMKRLKKGMGGFREVQKNIYVYSPLVLPIHGISSIRRMNAGILRAQIRRHLTRLHFREPIFWTYNPLTATFAGEFNEALLVYHCVDDLSASPGMPVGVITSAEEQLVRKADLVFTTNPNLQETRSRWNPANTHYFPNVADFDHFSKARRPWPIPHDIENIPKPRIGFVGAISDYKVDFELISHIAEVRPDWHWVLIGQVGEGQIGTSIDSLLRPNIHLLGPKSYQILPDYLRGFDVAVLPIQKNNYTASMFPMKFFEYLASGRTVVATDLPALREYADACIITHTPEGFIQGIEDVLHGKVPDPKRCLELAQQHTWEKRLDWMMELLVKTWEQKHGS